jgi:hypothetical protein
MKTPCSFIISWPQPRVRAKVTRFQKQLSRWPSEHFAADTAKVISCAAADVGVTAIWLRKSVEARPMLQGRLRQLGCNRELAYDDADGEPS